MRRNVYIYFCISFDIFDFIVYNIKVQLFFEIIFERNMIDMTFFEEIKRNASNVTDKAVKKTNELTSIAKLNVNVKSNENKLSYVFEEIGRLVYDAQSGENHDGEISDYIMKADKLKAEITAAKKQIAKLRKVVICEGCGNEISEESAFCSFCGLKQEKPIEEEAAVECCCACDECEEAEEVNEESAEEAEKIEE